MKPAEDIAKRLENYGSGTWGTDIFVGPVMPSSDYIPVNSIFVLSQSGPPGARVHSDRTEIRYPSVQVRVRDKSFPDGYDKAKDAYEALNAAEMTGYMDLRAEQSEPVYIGQNESGHFEWSINFTAVYGSD